MTVVILSLLALAIVVGWLIARRRQRPTRARDELPLFSIPLTSRAVISRPSRGAVADRYSGEDYAAPYEKYGPSSMERPDAPHTAMIRTRDGAASTSTLARAPRTDDSEVATSAQGGFGGAVDGASVRYWRAADGTLQFLPGRLEIAAGHDAGQEIRFVRTPGPDGTCITFGRAEGAPYRHVQLREPTVSRVHARMLLEAGSPNGSLRGSTTPNASRWRLENLSSTNPVVVNGRALDSNGNVASSVMLSEGDRIEMGEVAFIFHER